jgi:outer membrane protein assembly factor BamB
MLATSSGKDPPIVLLHCSLSSCCDVVTRGIAYDAGKIFLVTLDNHAVALDAKTGKEQWATPTGEINLGETTTAAPLVVKGKVFVGISDGELGVRGRITVLDEGVPLLSQQGHLKSALGRDSGARQSAEDH